LSAGGVEEFIRGSSRGGVGGVSNGLTPKVIEFGGITSSGIIPARGNLVGRGQVEMIEDTVLVSLVSFEPDI